MDATSMRALWPLDPEVAYLDHARYGAVPVEVLAVQQEWRARMEANPSQFLFHRFPAELDRVRQRVAAFLHADPAGVVFVDNATTGMQTVIAGMPLERGDEVVVTDHIYPAVLMQVLREQERRGIRVVQAEVPLSTASPADVASAVLERLTNDTRAVVVEHVASATGLVFPVERIVAECRARGVLVVVDGAHAAGMVPVDVDGLAPDFWVGNLHKWVCAPKTAAVLYAARQHRTWLRPLVGSHRLFDGYQPAFDWTGTRDPTPVLSAPAALDFFDGFGWDEVRRHNDTLAGRAVRIVAATLGCDVPGVAGDAMAAAMRAVPLGRAMGREQARALEDRLYAEHRVVVPVSEHGGQPLIRVSAQLYNTDADYERLATALQTCQNLDRL